MEYIGLTHAVKFKSLLYAAAGIWFGLSTAHAATCAVSLYSPVSENDCKSLQSLEAGRLIVSGQSEYVFECPGAPEGYRLYLIDSDPRSWYVVEHDGKRHSFEKMVVYDNPPGDFPNVGQGGRIEWVLDGDVVKGLIFRVSYQDKNATSSFSRLFSVGLEGDVPALQGLSDSNEAARQRLNYCRKK